MPPCPTEVSSRRGERWAIVSTISPMIYARPPTPNLIIVGGNRERLALSRRGCGKPVCARGAYRALLGDPSTSPLGLMTIDYNWTCTACGVADAEGTDICRQCGNNASFQ